MAHCLRQHNFESLPAPLFYLFYLNDPKWVFVELYRIPSRVLYNSVFCQDVCSKLLYYETVFYETHT